MYKVFVISFFVLTLSFCHKEKKPLVDSADPASVYDSASGSAPTPASAFDSEDFERNSSILVKDTGDSNDVFIPVGIKRIDDYAFEGKKLTSVLLPESVLHIGRRAFNNNKLTSVTIPASVTFIDFDAFSGNDITEINIGKGVSCFNRKKSF